MTYFHVFWTRPFLLEPPAGPDPLIELWDFEFLTWLTSALEIRRHTPVHLVTDRRGREFVERSGLAWVYGDHVSTALDDVPGGLRPDIFWAGGKLYAYRAIQPPCAAVDIDAILWRPLRPAGPVMALHMEDRQWSWYRSDRELFAGYGFQGADWHWDVDPCNAAVVYIESPALLESYRETAIRFMEDYSSRPWQPPSGSPPGLRMTSDPMIFAEQRLLAMCAARAGMVVQPLARVHANCHLEKNPLCSHLWGSKAIYMRCGEARAAYVNYLIRWLLDRHPEARSTLARWSLDRPVGADGTCDVQLEAARPGDPQQTRFSLIRRLNGVLWVEDANVNTCRPAHEGSLVWNAEVLRPEPGTSFELWVGGQKAVLIRQAGHPSRSTRKPHVARNSTRPG